MGPSTGEILAQYPEATPMFLVVIVLLGYVGYRHRDTVVTIVGGVLGVMTAGMVLCFSLYALTGEPRFEALAGLSFEAGATVFYAAYRVIDAVIVGILMAFTVLVHAAWAGVTWFLQNAAIPGVTANEFLLLMFTYQFVAGVVLIYVLYLWAREQLTAALTGAAGTVLFLSGMFSGLVQAQVWDIGETTLLGAVVVAPIGLMLGVAVMVIGMRPDFAGEQVAVADWVASLDDHLSAVKQAVFHRQ